MVIAHADVDAFFVSVERRDTPRYRDRPFVVAAEVVACASYEARELGVHAGMPLARVLHRWPEVVVAPPRDERYSRAGEELFALFRRYTPLLQPGSMEEAFLDVTGRDGGDPVALAAGLRRTARRELGLPVSVGLARSKLWAKLAGRRAKPDGLVVIDAEREAELRPALRLEGLWGVGPRTVPRLHEAGLFTVADLAGHDETSLAAIVPTAMVRTLLAIARGTDDATVRIPGPRRSVSAQRTISPPTRTRSTVLGVLGTVVGLAVDRLGHDPRRPSRLEVTVRFDDGTIRTGRAPLPGAVADPAGIERVARRLLEGTGWEDDGRGVTLAGVVLFLAAAREVPGQLALPFAPGLPDG
ncbi:DNA polymerase IV [Amycolatopsis antarctica]|uniref:DNA polymerase IV n=1 Tax=Amycolatopsis antarctica TaxID=1854586 RepID=A0A263D1H2_9PSEU|nr:DNA polymerase IV [Amycolatopsis antarctica]